VSEPFRVITADCPWLFRDSLPGRTRGASKQYACMSVADLCAFPLPPLADDCLLVFWRIASMQQEALDVVKAWGFKPKAELVWHKLTKNGKTHFGMGHYTRASHETALVCVRGRPKIRSRSVRSVFSAPVGRHSEKPGLFYTLVEELSEGPYVELFARKHRGPKWTCFGNELPSNDVEAAE
jgi:N6-adenosine-specific RNA methylase IME4